MFALAVGGALGLATMTACASSGAASTEVAAGQAAGSPGAASPAATSATDPNNPGSASPQNGRPAGSPGSAAGRCTADDLDLSFGSPTGAAAQQHALPLIVTNHADRRCTLTGYPGVDLLTASGDRYELPRSTQVTPTTISLAPNGRAQATLTYLTVADADADSTAFAAATVEVTPPDETRSRPLPWPGAPVLDQRAATHPGTYISAFTPTG